MSKKTLIIVVLIVVVVIGGIVSYIFISRRSTERKTNSKDSQVSSIDQTDSDNEEISPEDTVRLIFIHHSTGENWLADGNGGLGKALKDNNYIVSDTNYGWGENGIGDRTDIGNWWEWFRGPDSEIYMKDLYTETGQNSEYSRISSGSAKQNEIIMFKSCFPNSNFKGSANESPPDINDNSLRGESSDSEYHTVANAKGIYIDILKYFETQQDRLFIVITAPPLGNNNTDKTQADNARAFNNWLVNDWLDDYDYNNVVVFNFYHILTNYGKSNYLEFPSDEWDDHPSKEGNELATKEFIPFLNSAYNNWRAK